MGNRFPLSVYLVFRSQKKNADTSDRENKKGGENNCQALKYPGTLCLELIDWNLHAKLATSSHEVEPVPEKPRDKGAAKALIPSSDAIFKQ